MKKPDKQSRETLRTRLSLALETDSSNWLANETIAGKTSKIPDCRQHFIPPGRLTE
jgi:hypothetical protein